MATNITLVSGSPLSGSPVVYAVTSATLTGEVAFHRLKVAVSAALTCAADDTNVSDTSYKEMVMSSPVGNGETLRIDISSALRAVADRYEYAAQPPSSYPVINFSLRAWDEYMQNGTLYENVSEVTNSGGKALLGAYSDMERLFAGGSKLVSALTRKPTTMPEVVWEGDEYVRPTDMGGRSIGSVTTGPVSVSYPIVVDDTHPVGARSVGGANVYVAGRDDGMDRYQFRFINGYGVMESVSCIALRTTTVTIEKEKFAIARQESFSRFARGLYRKQNDVEQWKMSSGPLDVAWQSWFIHEFLMCRYAWIKIGAVWVPCHIVPEDTVNAINRTDGSLLSVDFTVEMDVRGVLQ